MPPSDRLLHLWDDSASAAVLVGPGYRWCSSCLCRYTPAAGGTQECSARLRLALDAAVRERDEERLEIGGALLMVNVPAEYAGGGIAPLTDRVHELVGRYRHAKLLADIAGYKIRDEGPPAAPLKEGDPMPPAVAWVCRLLSEMLEGTPGAENYVGWGWTEIETGKGYHILVSRMGGKTPETVASEAWDAMRRERDRAEALAVAVERVTETLAIYEDSHLELCAALDAFTRKK